MQGISHPSRRNTGIVSRTGRMVNRYSKNQNIAGFSHVIDSLSAIKYAKVKVVRDENGLAKDFEIEVI